MSTPIAEILPTKQLIPIDTSCTNRVKPTDTTDTASVRLTKNVSRYENDELYDELPDLVNSQYRGWFCKHFYRLGKDRVRQLAAIARADGHNPARYFAKLLKEAS